VYEAALTKMKTKTIVVYVYVSYLPLQTQKK
jgi:hypothetical protein